MIFRTLTIRMTNDHVSVAYALISYIVPLKDITDARLDETSALRYGGAGIKFAPVDGKRRLVFSNVSSPRIVLAMRGRRFDELVFSTARPDEVVKLIRDRMGEMDDCGSRCPS